MKKKLLPLIVCLGVLNASTLCAATIIWTGASSAIWDTTTNWQGGIAPTSSDIAVFGSAATAKTIATNAGPTGTGVAVAGMTFNTGGWTVNGFFTGLNTVTNNSGTNTIAACTTNANTTWTVAAGTSLIIQGANRPASGFTYSLNIGGAASTTSLAIGGGGTFTLNAGIYNSTNNLPSKLILNDINLIINTTTILVGTVGGVSYNINNAAATLSILTTDLATVEGFVTNGSIKFANGLNSSDFAWTQNGSYMTLAAIPEPSAYLLLGIGLITLTFLRRRGKALN